MLLAVTMRRWLWIDAEGSAVGAGGIGAASSDVDDVVAVPLQPHDGATGAAQLGAAQLGAAQLGAAQLGAAQLLQLLQPPQHDLRQQLWQQPNNPFSRPQQ